MFKFWERYRVTVKGLKRNLLIFLLVISTLSTICFWNEVSSYDAIHLDNKPRQAAVVLGAGTWGGKPNSVSQECLDQAYGLYKDGLIKFIVLSGGFETRNRGRRSKFTQAERMGRYLIEKGIPSTSLILEDNSKITRQQLLYSSYIVQEYNFSQVYLVTHDFHMSRAMYHAQKVGMNAAPAPVHSKELFIPYHKFCESFKLFCEKGIMIIKYLWKNF